MAIQLPNPGLGDGQTGDNEFVMWTKVKDNFNNSTHAASKVIGLGANDITDNKNTAKVVYGDTVLPSSSLTAKSLEELVTALQSRETGIRRVFFDNTSTKGWQRDNYKIITMNTIGPSLTLDIAFPSAPNNGTLQFRSISASSIGAWLSVYNSGNTTTEPSTGYVKVSSPVLNLLHNDFEKIHEAERLDIKVENPKVGVYRISGTTGLRKNDGWYFSPPKDEHNNVLCMVEVEEDGDIVVVKTYKKKFDFETVSIVPDYDNPTNIPDGAIVMLRFNDLHEELLDEPIE